MSNGDTLQSRAAVMILGIAIGGGSATILDAVTDSANAVRIAANTTAIQNVGNQVAVMADRQGRIEKDIDELKKLQDGIEEIKALLRAQGRQ